MFEIFSKEFNKKLFENIDDFCDLSTNKSSTLFIYGNPENLPQLEVEKYLNNKKEILYLYSNCEDNYSIQIPLFPILNPIKLHMNKLDFFPKIDKKSIKTINTAFNNEFEVDELFKKYRSFYGFKHKRDNKLNLNNIYEEIIISLEKISQDKKIIFFLNNFQYSDNSLVKLITTILNSSKIANILFLLLINDKKIEFNNDNFSLLNKSYSKKIYLSPPVSKYYSSIFINDKLTDKLINFLSDNSLELTLSKIFINSLIIKRILIKDDTSHYKLVNNLPISNLNHPIKSLLTYIYSLLSETDIYIAKILSTFAHEPEIDFFILICKQLNLNESVIKESMELLIKLGLFDVTKDSIIKFGNTIFEEYFRSKLDNNSSIIINKAIYKEFSKNKNDFSNLANNFVYGFNSENWLMAFEHIITISKCSLLLQSVSHSKNCMSFISEAIMPRLSKMDNFIKYRFHNFYAMVLTLNGKYKRAKQQLSLSQYFINESNFPDEEKLEAELFLNYAFLELNKNRIDYEKIKSYIESSLKKSSSMENRVATSNLIALTYYLEDNFDMAKIFFSDNLKILMMKKDIPHLKLEVDSSLRGLASISQKTNELRKSLSYINELLNLYKNDDNNLDIVAHTLQYRGMIYSRRCNFDNAIKDFEESLRIYIRISDRYGKSRILINLGEIYYKTGKIEESLHFFEESLKISSEIENKKGEAIAFGNIAQIMVMYGNFEEAHYLLEKDLKICEKLGDNYGKCHALLYKASTFFWENKLKKSKSLFESALSLSQKSNFSNLILASQLGLTRVLIELGNYYNAKEILNSLETRGFEKFDTTMEARFFAVKAELEINNNNLINAEKYLNLSFVVFEKVGLVFEKALCRIKEAKIAYQKGEKEVYLTSLSDARNIFMDMGAEYFFKNSDKLIKN